jgi:hypothetical protein
VARGFWHTDAVMASYQPPQFLADAFNCPLCGVYASQDWNTVYAGKQLDSLRVAHCRHCSRFSIWLDANMLFPGGGGPLPNPDLPEEIKADVQEAREILNLSPRGAAALLRLAIQKMCIHLGEAGDNLNDDIADLVANGLNPKVQKALDVVRVVGNNAVHPGEIDLRDDRETAGRLLQLVNLIAEQMITEPRRVDEIYETLPAEQREAIERRDSPQA